MWSLLALLCYMCTPLQMLLFFFFNDTATTEIYTLSLHDALPISSPTPRLLQQRGHPAARQGNRAGSSSPRSRSAGRRSRSEEHTSELQSQSNLVCRLLLEKKKKENSKIEIRTKFATDVYDKRSTS